MQRNMAANEANKTRDEIISPAMTSCSNACSI